jgi:hypothetical protein
VPRLCAPELTVQLHAWRVGVFRSVSESSGQIRSIISSRQTCRKRLTLRTNKQTNGFRLLTDAHRIARAFSIRSDYVIVICLSWCGVLCLGVILITGCGRMWITNTIPIVTHRVTRYMEYGAVGAHTDFSNEPWPDLSTHAVIPRSGRINRQIPPADALHSFPPWDGPPAHASIPQFAIFISSKKIFPFLLYDAGFVNFFFSAYVLFPALGDWQLAATGN